MKRREDFICFQLMVAFNTCICVVIGLWGHRSVVLSSRWAVDRHRFQRWTGRQHYEGQQDDERPGPLLLDFLRNPDATVHGPRGEGATTRPISLWSTRQLIHNHRRRLLRENRSAFLFELEEQLIEAESYRHLSRFEQFYRLQNGIDLQLGWDGVYNISTASNAHFPSFSRNESVVGAQRRPLQQQQHGRSLSSAKTAATATTMLMSGKFDNYQAIPLSQGYGTHIAHVWVGSPKPQRKTVIVDTGSHYTAFPCKGCSNCGRSHHTDPYFNPSKSDTYYQLQCDECKGGVTCEKGRCHFSQAYTEGSSWDAIQVRDKFYCGGFDVLDSVDPTHQKYTIDFMFGCMTKMSGTFVQRDLSCFCNHNLFN